MEVDAAGYAEGAAVGDGWTTKRKKGAEEAGRASEDGAMDENDGSGGSAAGVNGSAAWSEGVRFRRYRSHRYSRRVGEAAVDWEVVPGDGVIVDGNACVVASVSAYAGGEYVAAAEGEEGLERDEWGEVR